MRIVFSEVPDNAECILGNGTHGTKVVGVGRHKLELSKSVSTYSTPTYGTLPVLQWTKKTMEKDSSTD